MAQASPALAVASVAAQSFSFPARPSVKVQVRFYTDLAGTIAIAGGTGSRDLTATMNSAVSDTSTYRAPALESAIDGGVIVGVVGGTWYEIALADGGHQINIAATGGADPGGALSYRILLDTERGV